MHRPADVDIEILLRRLGIEAERRGAHWFARCPFHDDKNPSWAIRDEPGSPRHGKHRCYACDEAGSHVYLVMRLLGTDDARQAWLWIAEGADLARDRLAPIKVEVVDGEAKRFRLPPGCTLDPELARWPYRIQRYAMRRNITAEQVARWRLGFAVEGRLRGRLVIPVRDSKASLVSYTARAVRDNERRKYLEPKHEEGASQAAIFGEELWRPEQRAIVVSEGALNALAWERALSARADVAVGAAMGSHFMPEHALKFSRFALVYVAADPDKAGDKMREAMRQMGRWVELRQVVFPDGADACDVERVRGSGALLDLLG